MTQHRFSIGDVVVICFDGSIYDGQRGAITGTSPEHPHMFIVADAGCAAWPPSCLRCVEPAAEPEPTCAACGTVNPHSLCDVSGQSDDEYAPDVAGAKACDECWSTKSPPQIYSAIRARRAAAAKTEPPPDAPKAEPAANPYGWTCRCDISAADPYHSKARCFEAATALDPLYPKASLDRRIAAAARRETDEAWERRMQQEHGRNWGGRSDPDDV